MNQKVPFGEVCKDKGQDAIYNIHGHYDFLVSLIKLLKDDLSEHRIDECEGLIQDIDEFLEIHAMVLEDNELSDDELKRLGLLSRDLFTEVDSILDEVMPYSYYGVAAGAQNIGVWPSINALERAVFDKEVIKIEAGDDVPKGYHGPVMLVNDHGNVTYGEVCNMGEFHEIWSCV